MHPSIKYAHDVISGDILACRFVKLACRRHLDDLKRTDIYFDEAAADHALEFFGHLKLWKGKGYKGKPFVLGPHYQFIVSNLMGWKRPDGTRRFRIGYIEMGRKGAKSTFAGGLGAYFFVADNEPGAEIYAGAVKKDQAKIVWSNIRNLTKNSIFAPMIRYYTHNLSIEDTMSKCEALSSDSKSLDGLDTHFASLDELHAHPTPDVHDLIVDSMGARSQPMVLIITTAGFDQSGVCYQRRDYLSKILKGAIQDDSFFGIIYTLDTKKDWPELQTADEFKQDPKQMEDDWELEVNWIKSMPGLCGITNTGERYGVDEDGNEIPGFMTKIDDVRDKARYAKSNPAALNNTLTKRFNIWTQQATRWIDLGLWDLNFTSEVYCYEN